MKELFLICNAHLDPVWQWEWEEGAAETLSTYRIAARFIREFGGFVFNHNEAILYRWVEEYDPELFKEIQALVAEGRWHIMVGRYLQPDCNMPSGEGFVRQIQAGRKYFWEKFKKYPTTAINFDPFGHSRGLVQIMKKSGFDSYMFMRPYRSWLTLPNEDFKWVGFDGSTIYARRTGSYNSPKGRATDKIRIMLDACPENDFDVCLWGVGNHGGGPSKKDLEMIEELQKEMDAKDIKVIHSTPEEYFANVRARKGDLPEFKESINLWAPGCYTSIIRIKQQYRALENMLFMTENMCAAAAANGLMEYPHDELCEAERDLITVQFHDMLPGSCIQAAEETTLRQLAHGQEILSRIKLRAFNYLCAGQKAPDEDKIPILIFNPHPFAIDGDFECEMMLWDQNWAEEYSYPVVYSNGKELPTQSEKERSTINLDWRKRVSFHAHLEPMQMNRFDCGFKKLPSRPKAQTREDESCFYLENGRVTARIGKASGYLESYLVDGVEMLKAPCRLNIIKDDCDPWGMNVSEFSDVIGAFSAMTVEDATAFAGIKEPLEAVHTIESGAVRTTVEALLRYGDSKAVIHYTLSERDTDIKISVRIHWAESQKMIKLCIPCTTEGGRCFGQVPYGVEEFKGERTERCAHRYAMLDDGKNTIGVINNGTYGFAYEDETLYITLLRSAVYCAHPIDDRETLPQDRYMAHIDQGERCFEMLLFAGKSDEVNEEIPRKAMVFNERPMSLSVYCDSDKDYIKPFIRIEGDKIEVPVIKKADNGIGYVVRLFNPFNRSAQAKVIVEAVGVDMEVALTPYEIKTLLITDEITECGLIEGDFN